MEEPNKRKKLGWGEMGEGMQIQHWRSVIRPYKEMEKIINFQKVKKT
jgi:hypothetical protein